MLFTINTSFLSGNHGPECLANSSVVLFAILSQKLVCLSHRFLTFSDKYHMKYIILWLAPNTPSCFCGSSMLVCNAVVFQLIEFCFCGCTSSYLYILLLLDFGFFFYIFLICIYNNSFRAYNLALKETLRNYCGMYFLKYNIIYLYNADYNEIIICQSHLNDN